jgi:hypothetical protein
MNRNERIAGMEEILNRHQDLCDRMDVLLEEFDAHQKEGRRGTVKSSSQLWTPFTMSRCLFIQ